MSESNQQDAPLSISEEAVVDYLRAHPDFFVTHEYLLNELRLPHQSGSAISLGERQVQVFREHRDQLRDQLNELVQNARLNDQHFEKSKSLLLDMLDVRSLDEIELVIQAAFEKDANIDYARVVLFGDANDFPVSQISVVSEQEARQELGAAIDSQNAICGRFTDQQLEFIYGADAKDVGSAAIMPLRNGSLYGVFSLASRDEHHFESSMGSLFLSYISDFMARLLPSLLSKARSVGHNEKVPSLLD